MPTYYDDLAVGQIIDYGRYTMERDEMLAFARQWDPRPFHVDEEAARRSIFGGLTAAGTHTMAALIKLCNQATADWAVSGALGYESLRFAAPVKVGDELHAQSEIVGKRESNSRPGFGIVRARETVTNQNGEVVLDLTVAYLMRRRPAEKAAG